MYPFIGKAWCCPFFLCLGSSGLPGEGNKGIRETLLGCRTELYTPVNFTSMKLIFSFPFCEALVSHFWVLYWTCREWEEWLSFFTIPTISLSYTQWFSPCYLLPLSRCMCLAPAVAQSVKNLSAMQETRVRFLCWEVPLEKGIAIHASIPAWRIPWTEKPGGLQSVGSQRVGHDWATNTHTDVWVFSYASLYWASSFWFSSVGLPVMPSSNLCCEPTYYSGLLAINF